VIAADPATADTKLPWLNMAPFGIPISLLIIEAFLSPYFSHNPKIAISSDVNLNLHRYLSLNQHCLFLQF
jgi:hypothetical protein